MEEVIENYPIIIFSSRKLKSKELEALRQNGKVLNCEAAPPQIPLGIGDIKFDYIVFNMKVDTILEFVKINWYSYIDKCKRICIKSFLEDDGEGWIVSCLADNILSLIPSSDVYGCKVLFDKALITEGIEKPRSNIQKIIEKLLFLCSSKQENE